MMHFLCLFRSGILVLWKCFLVVWDICFLTKLAMSMVQCLSGALGCVSLSPWLFHNAGRSAGSLCWCRLHFSCRLWKQNGESCLLHYLLTALEAQNSLPFPPSLLPFWQARALRAQDSASLFSCQSRSQKMKQEAERKRRGVGSREGKEGEIAGK